MANELNESERFAKEVKIDEEEEEEEEEEQIEEWDDWQSEEEDSVLDFLCLFCTSRFDSTLALFKHCSLDHSFDFHGVVRNFALDFYGSIKLINYIRSQVAENKCWVCRRSFQCNGDLQNHFHVGCEMDGKVLWEDDSYLKPYMEDDSLLHSFACDEDEDDCTTSMDKEVMRELISSEDLAELCSNGELDAQTEIGQKGCCLEIERIVASGISLDKSSGSFHQKNKNEQLRVSRGIVAAREIKSVNDNYFGAYGSFGIHREMLSDKVRTDTYRCALLSNPTLMDQATVLDVGCGTGILSLFAAQAGASRVIAVEASAKMATVATQVAKDNGLLADWSMRCEQPDSKNVVSVVHCMVEDLDKHVQVPPHSVDVLVSEWMGYCLLYESMLNSVLYARDHFLKPGGAILPDTATIFGAGFGRGGTSLPFWENVYGYDMSCIGKEVVEDASCVPIVDVVNSQDIVTESAMLHFFDLVLMKQDEMDFTSTFDLKLKSEHMVDSAYAPSGVTWCYGIVLWFETGFTSRFCKETPALLSTSPYSPKTHWSQTIFTFKEPIAMTAAKSITNSSAAIGSKECPATTIRSRISIARSSEHRSIDVSMETTGISSTGRKHSWPVQIFNL
ncbi:probable protein arginine N-methyltransferase 3 [Typha angustifolia]|uniref:probable protein arginine N-methyltransferase 3 n=1 Tax=Typha angustifolia TaxID=59011 RepID=UPI003C2F8694